LLFDPQQEETRMARTLLLVSIVFICLAPQLLLADEIVLDNDTRLTGTVTGLAGSVLTLTSDYAEPIQIKKERITRISTDKPVELHLASGEIIKGRLTTGDDGRIVVNQGDGRSATGIDLKSIAAINPPPARKWQGNASLAGSLETGNTDKSGFAFGAEAMRRGDDDRFSMRFLYNIAQEDNKMNTRNVFGAMQYDYFFAKKYYAYLGTSFFNDTFKDLKLRTIVGPGIGYQVWEEPDKALALEAGIAYFNRDLENEGDQSWISARLAANIRYKLTKWLVFTDRLGLFPSLENANDFLLRNEAALTTVVGAGWSLKLADVLEYVNNPANERKSTDSLFTVGLQYDF
jgi:putative salt-induced outer membrane protein YdiY